MGLTRLGTDSCSAKMLFCLDMPVGAVKFAANGIQPVIIVLLVSNSTPILASCRSQLKQSATCSRIISSAGPSALYFPRTNFFSIPMVGQVPLGHAVFPGQGCDQLILVGNPGLPASDMMFCSWPILFSFPISLAESPEFQINSAYFTPKAVTQSGRITVKHMRDFGPIVTRPTKS